MQELEQQFRDRLRTAPLTDSMTLALRYGCSTYDARFLALATQAGQRLITDDRRLRNKAPELTQSLEQALSG